VVETAIPDPDTWITWQDSRGVGVGRVRAYRGRVFLIGEALEVEASHGTYIVRLDDVTAPLDSTDDVTPLLQHEDPHVRRGAFRALADL